MNSLEFREIANLVNHSRTTKIDETSANEGDCWALHNGTYRVHQHAQAFQVLYLNAKFTNAGVSEAKKAIGGRRTDIVYAGSLEGRTSAHREFATGANKLWSSREYLASFIEEELLEYKEHLTALKPTHYIEPRVETPSGFIMKVPNPVYSFMASPTPPALLPDCAIGIVLADPGQGKTYMCRHVVANLFRRDSPIFPIFIDSTQWSKLGPEELRSLSVTIANSFRHHHATIGWLDGHEDEFLRVALKAGLFRIVFDGFDEYILRGQGNLSPFDTLETLSELAAETGARIMITSRTSFWEANLPAEQTSKFIGESKSVVFKLLPFDLPHARNYFSSRLKNEDAEANAAATFQQMYSKSPSLAGRGFVLSLLADAFEDLAVASPRDANASPLEWLIESLCQREVLRQELELDAPQQLAVLRELAWLRAGGEITDNSMIDFVLETTRSDLIETGRKRCIEKLRSHPLLEFAQGQWDFRQDQVFMAVLARSLADRVASDIVGSAQLRLALTPESTQDLASELVEIYCEGSDEQQSISAISKAVRVLGGNPDTRVVSELAAVLALRSVDAFLKKGSQRDARTRLLQVLSGKEAISGMHFTGSIGSYDLRGVKFSRCSFTGVTFANCVFDATTGFEQCEFVGGGELNSSGTGLAAYSQCRFDDPASRWNNSVRVRDGARSYTVADAESELRALVLKFVVRGGVGFRSIQDHHLRQGSIAHSPHRDVILRAVSQSILNQHEISGISDKGWHIRDEARDSVLFLTSNNLLTGRLRQALQVILTEIGLG